MADADTREQFKRVTGEPDFPVYLANAVRNGILKYDSNLDIFYPVRGVPMRLEILWEDEAPSGAGDTFQAVYRGTLSLVKVR